MPHDVDHANVAPSESRRTTARQLLIAWICAGCAIGLFAPVYPIFYWRGFFQGTLQEVPRYLHMDQFLFIMSGTCWLLGLGFVVTAIVLSFQSGHRPSAVGVAVVVLTLCVTPLIFVMWGPGAPHHVEGFRDGVRKLPVDYETIRRWRARRQVTNAEIAPVNSLPEPIVKLRPQFVTLTPDGATVITYGSGFGHWGITVYPNSDAPAGAFNVAPGVEAWYSE